MTVEIPLWLVYTAIGVAAIPVAYFAVVGFLFWSAWTYSR